MTNNTQPLWMMSLISLGLQKIKIKDEEAKCHTSILQGIDIHPGRKISNNFNFFSSYSWSIYDTYDETIPRYLICDDSYLKL